MKTEEPREEARRKEKGREKGRVQLVAETPLTWQNQRHADERKERRKKGITANISSHQPFNTFSQGASRGRRGEGKIPRQTFPTDNSELSAQIGAGK